jgi:hypothetical protein
MSEPSAAEAVFCEALEKEPAERAAFLDRACAGSFLSRLLSAWGFGRSFIVVRREHNRAPTRADGGHFRPVLPDTMNEREAPDKSSLPRGTGRQRGGHSPPRLAVPGPPCSPLSAQRSNVVGP